MKRRIMSRWVSNRSANVKPRCCNAVTAAWLSSRIWLIAPA
jgi:hypothetical protein